MSRKSTIHATAVKNPSHIGMTQEVIDRSVMREVNIIALQMEESRKATAAYYAEKGWEDDRDMLFA